MFIITITDNMIWHNPNRILIKTLQCFHAAFLFLAFYLSLLVCFHPFVKPLFPGPPPSRRSLQRTLSDESIYSGQREPSSSGQRETPTDLLFSCSTMPRSPIARHGPSRRASHKSLGKHLVYVIELVVAPKCSGLRIRIRNREEFPTLKNLLTQTWFVMCCGGDLLFIMEQMDYCAIVLSQPFLFVPRSLTLL